MEPLAQHVLSLMATGLGLSPDFFSNSLTAEPTPLFRIFRYPPHPSDGGDRWGVAEHSDYGLLTLLAHDGKAGLEVKVGDTWIAAPNDPALIICNLGDMLDRLTAGRYRSTPHRARNHADQDRYSLPFFLDPGWDAVIEAHRPRRRLGRSRRCRPTLGQGQPPRSQRHVRRLAHRQGQQGLPRSRRCAARRRVVQRVRV